MYQNNSNPYQFGTYRLMKDFTLDGGFNIRAGSLTGNNSGTTVTLTWDAAAAQNPPEADWPH